MVPVYGGSRGLRFCLASRMSRGVRYPRPPPIKDKCKHELVESTKVYLCVRKSGLIYPPWKWEIAGSNPATQTSYVVLSVPVRTSLCESDRMGSTPIDQPKIICPGDGIGIHTGLRSRVLRVQVSPRAPYIKTHCPTQGVADSGWKDRLVTNYWKLSVSPDASKR